MTIKIETIAQGLRQVKLPINLTSVEIAALTGFSVHVQTPSGVVDIINLANNALSDGSITFTYNFIKDGNYAVQAISLFGSNSVTSLNSLVFQVDNAINTPAIQPAGKYINKQDLTIYLSVQRLTEISDRDQGAIDDNAKIQQSINHAESLVDAYISQAYSMPIACGDNSVPSLLKKITIDLAVWHHYEQRVSEEVAERYKQAMYFLEQIAKGDMGLVCANGQKPNALNASQISGGVAVGIRTLQGFCNVSNHAKHCFN